MQLFRRESFSWILILVFGATIINAAKLNYAASGNENTNVFKALRANLQNNSDPCDNFWLYACGGWTSDPLQRNMDTFVMLGNEYAGKLQSLLENELLNEQSQLWGKLRAYLEACKNQAAQTFTTLPLTYLQQLDEMQTVVNYMDLLTALTGASSGLANFNWLLTIAELRRFGVNNIFLREAVDVASFNATLQVVDISMPAMYESFESKYEILSYLQAFQQDLNKQLPTEVFALELNLKTLQNKQLKSNNPERLLNLAELTDVLPQVHWQLYFNTLLRHDTSNKMLIRITDVNYIRELMDLLQFTPPTTINAYILAKLSKFIFEERLPVGKYACIKHMLIMLPLGLDHIYNKYLYETRQEDEQVLENIVENLKTQFSLNLQQVPQLNPKQMNFIRLKLLNMQLRIGNLPLDTSDEYYEHYYEGTLINASNFYNNHWEMLRFRTLQQHTYMLAAIQQPQAVQLTKYVVNDDIKQARDAPYFVHTRNLLIVPMVFLQLPFYHHSLHHLLHYSLLGWMLAHEMQHAFDPDGILLNVQGIDSNVGDSIRNTVYYASSIECLNAQLPPPVSLAERMADVYGLKLAFDAYFEQVPRSWIISDMPFSSKQIFFLNSAQIFCGALPTPIQHDRDDVRVIMSMANMPQFAAAFQCATKSRENPSQRCQMWS